ncbi:uracil-DNA glycosylase family protein [Ectothiorhodospira haloalkaliphila]|uniref:uracil-DNA glycosylase family protein n=1 Tax=Ectothiorhodospira haloalkaliphila TaxID=421628 RepID=UPI001EE9AD27|nr:uracil-DNA glycosylase family protein [Ectothiorhodospira haloalkaliphila]MCG5525886.1 uracil-DNA glycosylase family protein [Ectothiorhodospira haloalkaliphila]
MDNSSSLFDRYAPILRSGSLFNSTGLAQELRIAQEGDIETYYAPFDHVERDARLVLVGITPGLTQARNALLEAQRQLSLGASPAMAERLAKTAASFSGSMRNNLVRLLDFIGVHEWLGVDSTDQVFNPDSRLVHYTSVLRYPVFLRGQNYNGQPAPDKSPLLQAQIEQWFASEVDQLRQAVFIPLGSIPQQVMAGMVDSERVARTQVLQSLPHPSGANAERIAYFLGTKSADKCSSKCNTRRLDMLREQALQQVRELIASSR